MRSFYLGKTEVTNAEYARCVSARTCEPPQWKEAGSDYNLRTGADKLYQGFTRDQQPVVGVSWHNAMVYARASVGSDIVCPPKHSGSIPLEQALKQFIPGEMTLAAVLN